MRYDVRIVPPEEPHPFNLDELARAGYNPGSFPLFMDRWLFSRSLDSYPTSTLFAGIREVRTRNTIGTKRQIGFSEPGTSFANRTRRVRLTENPWRRRRANFPGEMPHEALTMEIANIMAAHSLILVALVPKSRIF